MQNNDQSNTKNRERINPEKATNIEAKANPVGGTGHTFEGTHEDEAGMNEEGEHAGTADLTRKTAHYFVVKTSVGV